MNLVISLKYAEWPAIAAPDVDCGWLGVAAIIPVAYEGLIEYAAGNVADRRLGIDDEVFFSKSIPDLVNVLAPVVGKSRFI